MKNRIQLAEYFNQLGYKTGAEIGVHRGRYSEILCQAMPGLKLLAVDKWTRHWGKAYPDAVARLEPYGVTVVRAASIDAAVEVQDGSLDFVYIDAEHSYEAVRQDLQAWVPKVRDGGMVAGHDYYYTRSGNGGVIEAVDEFVKENRYTLHLTDWDYKNPVEDDRQPSWYFKKEQKK